MLYAVKETTMAAPDKHIREAIKYAEERGFRVIKAGPRAHEWGHLHCTEASREGCRIAVGAGTGLRDGEESLTNS